MKQAMALALCLWATAAMAAEDRVLADFEGDTYGDWTVEGDAFGDGPARGTRPDQMPVTGFKGSGLVNSYNGGDDARGRLTSPPFIITHRYINFLIGGGGYPRGTCINLLVDGETVRTAEGPNRRSGGSEALLWHAWEVADLEGTEAKIEIVDRRKGTWGHINIDHIVLSDRRASPDKTMTFTAESRYLNLPVQNTARKVWMRLRRGDEILREFDIALAADGDSVDFWVTLELTAFAGQELRLSAERASGTGFDLIAQADTLRGADDLYNETYRPQFHFTARRGWNNDPNGMVYFDGEYHLFFQHNPFGRMWGNMTWGHAVSEDLVHWEQLPNAIHPDEHGTIFSGSAVVDWNNTTGFQTGEAPPLVCIYTYAGGQTPQSEGKGYTQALAYSNDRGRTWTKYAGNPVLEELAPGNRDPKVIWHAPTEQWVIVLFLEGKRAAFFTSPDLKTWTKTSEFEGLYECPELFTLPVDGNPQDVRWILYGASGEYFVGQFDGKAFHAEAGPLPFSHGDCFYASQVFNDMPAEDGRRIQIAWGRTGQGDMPFNQMMNFPVTLTLRSTPEGPRLFAHPVRELARLHGAETPATMVRPVLAAGETVSLAVGREARLAVSFAPGAASGARLALRGLSLSWSREEQTIKAGDQSIPIQTDENIISFTALMDQLSLEIFGGEGRYYMPLSHVFDPRNDTISITAEGGSLQDVRVMAMPLESIWK